MGAMLRVAQGKNAAGPMNKASSLLPFLVGFLQQSTSRSGTVLEGTCSYAVTADQPCCSSSWEPGELWEP